MQFIFKTNESSSTTYDGPSGTRYVIFGKKPFEVEISGDVAFFRTNKRFEEVTIFTPEPEPKKDIDVVLKEEIESLKLTKKTTEKILKSYISRVDFIADLEEGAALDGSVSKKDVKKIKSYFIKKKKR